VITSKDNEKLKLVRALGQRKHRERERLFVTEGEDLLEAGLAAGARPQFVLVAAGSGLDGEEVEPELLARASTLGSGTRVIAVWPIPEPRAPAGPACVYLHGVGDPGNVGTIARSADALVGGTLALGPGCADPYGPKAVRASMGSVFAVRPVRADFDETPAPRVALVARGGDRPAPLEPPVTLCLGAEREGLPAELVERCDARWTIPLRAGVDSLNVSAAAAIALERINSATAERGDE
jgi:TrmH family RNA methyltransferase